MLEYRSARRRSRTKPASVVDGDMDSGEGKSRASMWRVYLASTIPHMSVRGFYTPGTGQDPRRRPRPRRRRRVAPLSPPRRAAGPRRRRRAGARPGRRAPRDSRRKLRWVDTFHMGARDAIGKRMSDQERLVAGAAADPGSGARQDRQLMPARPTRRSRKFLDDEGQDPERRARARPAPAPSRRASAPATPRASAPTRAHPEPPPANLTGRAPWSSTVPMPEDSRTDDAERRRNRRKQEHRLPPRHTDVVTLSVLSAAPPRPRTVSGEHPNEGYLGPVAGRTPATSPRPPGCAGTCPVAGRPGVRRGRQALMGWRLQS